ncbi:Guanine nucleotide-binding protein alpha-2 subunit [Tulasnella sp. 403]|nr:Guanine nucleotide-binding protein alpha-2 subunit [Tulasnella sp. 403]
MLARKLPRPNVKAGPDATSQLRLATLPLPVYNSWSTIPLAIPQIPPPDMGLYVSRASRKAHHQRKISDQIDKSLEKDRRRAMLERTVLLLGLDGSGKSTIVKQMKITHLNDYSKQDLLFFRTIVYKNLVECAQDIILAMMTLGIDCADPTNRENAQRILSYAVDSDPESLLDPEIALAIESLVNDPTFPLVMDQPHTFHLIDSAQYFFGNVKRIGEAGYVPNETDVLHARAKSIGIMETRFTFGQLSIRVVDVGGQRSERKKWIHCFENVTSILFCVAISEYDQVLLEENTQNRMHESLTLFESVVNSRWFSRTSIILFLNKIDVFKAKLKKSPLEAYFPEYTGGADINKAAKYILWRFAQCNRQPLSLYPHLTCATDTSNIRLLFAAVKETMLANVLKKSGIL